MQAGPWPLSAEVTHQVWWPLLLRLRPILHIGFDMPRFHRFLHLICLPTDSHCYWETITTWNVVSLVLREIWWKVRQYGWDDTHPQNSWQHLAALSLCSPLWILRTLLFSVILERRSQWHKPITLTLYQLSRCFSLSLLSVFNFWKITSE